MTWILQDVSKAQCWGYIMNPYSDNDPVNSNGFNQSKVSTNSYCQNFLRIKSYFQLSDEDLFYMVNTSCSGKVEFDECSYSLLFLCKVLIFGSSVFNT